MAENKWPPSAEEVERNLRSALKPATPDVRERVLSTLREKPAVSLRRSRFWEFGLGLAVALAAAIIFALLLPRFNNTLKVPEKDEHAQLPSLTPAGDDPELIKQVDALLPELDAEAFEKREEARQKLRALGP